MPTINRKQITVKQPKWKSDENDHEKYYSSTQWRTLRQYYIARHAVCEECLKHDKVTAAYHVHHKYIFHLAKDDMVRWQLLLDESNLMALCPKCHTAMHRKARQNNLTYIDNLTDQEYAEAHMIFNDTESDILEAAAPEFR